MPIELSEDVELNKKIVVNLSRGKTVIWLDDEGKVKKIIKPRNSKDLIYVRKTY